MLKQQNGDGGKRNESEEGTIQSVISGSDSAKPLDLLEEALHQIALLIQGPLYRPGIGDVALGRNHTAGPVL